VRKAAWIWLLPVFVLGASLWLVLTDAKDGAPLTAVLYSLAFAILVHGIALLTDRFAEGSTMSLHADGVIQASHRRPVGEFKRSTTVNGAQTLSVVVDVQQETTQLWVKTTEAKKTLLTIRGAMDLAEVRRLLREIRKFAPDVRVGVTVAVGRTPHPMRWLGRVHFRQRSLKKLQYVVGQRAEETGLSPDDVELVMSDPFENRLQVFVKPGTSKTRTFLAAIEDPRIEIHEGW
jgi:hypothetical protein